MNAERRKNEEKSKKVLDAQIGNIINKVEAETAVPHSFRLCQKNLQSKNKQTKKKTKPTTPIL